MAAGLVLATLAAPADLLISRDGRHAAVRLQDGRLAFLRNRSCAFLSNMWGDSLATDGGARFGVLPGMACSRDACVASIDRGGRPGACSQRCRAISSIAAASKPPAPLPTSSSPIVGCRHGAVRADKSSIAPASPKPVHLPSGSAHRGSKWPIRASATIHGSRSRC
jgi:competence protein ComEC